jgi:hypothetical protein
MGNEVNGAVRDGKNRYEGKILLETTELVFRSREYRLKIVFGEIRGLKAADGELRIETRDGVRVFEVGECAERWREKILHPKTRIEKLGAKAGMRVRIAGQSAADFEREIKAGKAEILGAGNSDSAELTFFFVDAKHPLSKVAGYAKKLKNAEALWIVYPKGQREITESQVIFTGRKAGLKDVKVVGFSATHTALKFVLPVEKR